MKLFICFGFIFGFSIMLFGKGGIVAVNVDATGKALIQLLVTLMMAAAFAAGYYMGCEKEKTDKSTEVESCERD